jgi:hypothetical protein
VPSKRERTFTDWSAAPSGETVINSNKDIWNCSAELRITESERRYSRKDAKHATFGENRRIFNFAPWRLGAKHFLEVVLFNFKVRI